MTSNDSWQSILEDLEGVEKNSPEYYEAVQTRVIPKLFSFLKDDSNQTLMQSYDILEEIQRMEEHVFGNRTYLNIVQEYTSGSQMLYEAFLALCNNFLKVMPEHRGTSLKDIITLIQFALSVPTWTSRVMGQYDFLEVSKGMPEELRVCTTNIKNIAEEKDLLYSQLLRYVIIHEEIHNWQSKTFNVNGLMLDLLQKNDKQSLMNLMTCLEGHAEFFANMFAETLIPGFVFARSEPTFWNKLKYKVFGLDKQMERYTKGEKFIKMLYSEGGISMINKIFEIIPTQYEIESNAFQYINRVDPDCQLLLGVDIHN